MSISTIDMESEQNERPTNCSPMGRRGSDTRVPPSAEEDEDMNGPWMDCLLNEESDESSSIDIPKYRKDIQYNDVTICEKENCSVNSGTDGGNSDIGVLADFRTMKKSQRWNNSPVVEYPVVNVRGVSNRWSGALKTSTDTDDSAWEDADEREKRLYIERYNFDLSERIDSSY